MARDAAVLGMMLWNVPPEDEAAIHPALIAGLSNGTLNPVVEGSCRSPRPLKRTARCWSRERTGRSC